MKKILRTMMILLIIVCMCVSFCACANAAGLMAGDMPSGEAGVEQTPGAQYILAHIKSIIKTAVIALAGWIALEIKPFIVKFFKDKIKRQVAEICMNAVEQIYKTLHGEEKLKKALEMAAVMLKKRGIEFDAEDMMNMIEAAVGAFNANLKYKELFTLDEATT